jgi:hypothetical protein
MFAHFVSWVALIPCCESSDESSKGFSKLSRSKTTVSLWNGRLSDMVPLSMPPIVAGRESRDGVVNLEIQPPLAAKQLPSSVMDALRGMSLDVDDEPSFQVVKSPQPEAEPSTASAAMKLAKLADTVKRSLSCVQAALETPGRDMSRDAELFDAAIYCVEAQTALAWLASKLSTK